MTRLSLLALLVLVGCRQPALSQNPPASPGLSTFEAAEAQIGSGRRTAITRAVETASPAVVSVNVIGVRNVRIGDPFFDRFFGRPDRVYQQQVQGFGSGFLVSPDGFLVTNEHVVAGASQITVALADGTQLSARLVGSDAETDIALLKVEADAPLPYLAFDDDHAAVVGEWAIALGNPFGLFQAAEPTVTVGVISGLGRDFPAQQGRTFRDMIQTDAAINSGNSGGPLLNALGRVVGMNTFIYSQSGGSVGIGFAVPSWRVRRVVDELRSRGRVDRSFYTGLNVRPVDARVARALGLDVTSGLVVTSVDAGSPAERAGLRPYDVVVSLGGQPVRSNEDVRQLLTDSRAGDTVRLGTLRDGRERTVSLVLAQGG